MRRDWWTACRGAVVGFVAIWGPLAAQDASALVELRELVKARRYADAWALAPKACDALATAKAPAEAIAEAARLRLQAGLEVVGAGAGFHGSVTAPEPGILDVSYTGPAAKYETDFELTMPIPSGLGAERRGQIVSGTGAFSHRALWTDPVKVTISGIARGDHDFGILLDDPDEVSATRFLIGNLNNSFFGVKYGKDRKATTGHVLLMSGRGAESRSARYPTQLFAVCPVPPLRRGAPVAMTIALESGSVAFAIGETRVAHALTPTTQTFDRLRPGLFVSKSAFEITSIAIRGRLDPAWQEDELARLREEGNAAPR